MFPDPDATAERLQGSVEHVTFHSPESGLCVLRIKVLGQRDLVTAYGAKIESLLSSRFAIVEIEHTPQGVRGNKSAHRLN